MIKKMILLTIATATMLAPAALAGHDNHRYYASDSIMVLADDLVVATRQVNRDAARGWHGRRGPSREMLYAFDRLAKQARSFRRDAARGSSLRRLDNELDELFVAFDRADRRMRRVRSARLQRDFERVGRVMQRLARNVEAAIAHRHRDRRDGRRARVVLAREPRGGLHGAVVLGDERLQVRVRF